MKEIFIFLPVLGMLTANAEAPPSESLEAQTVRRALETPPTLDEIKPNEIKAGPVSYSGIAVEIVKIDNPFQLINPAAPAEYGFAEQNVIREPADGKISGLKIFSIQF